MCNKHLVEKIILTSDAQTPVNYHFLQRITSASSLTTVFVYLFSLLFYVDGSNENKHDSRYIFSNVNFFF